MPDGHIFVRDDVGLGTDGGGDYTALWVCLTPLSHTLTNGQNNTFCYIYFTTIKKFEEGHRKVYYRVCVSVCMYVCVRERERENWN